MKQKCENLQQIKGDEAIASGVWPASAVNDAGTPTRFGTQLTQPRSRPVRYGLIDKDGKSVATNSDAGWLVGLAGRLWPDQEQDPDRSGKGWDISVVGVE